MNSYKILEFFFFLSSNAYIKESLAKGRFPIQEFLPHITGLNISQLTQTRWFPDTKGSCEKQSRIADNGWSSALPVKGGDSQRRTVEC